MFHFIQSGILAFLFFSGLTAFLSAVLYPRLRKSLLKLPCYSRLKILILWLLAPLFLGSLLTIFGLLPSWLETHEVATAHCSTHSNGIAHLCWFDPMVHLSDIFWLIGALLMFVIALLHLYKVVQWSLNYYRFQIKLQQVSCYHPKYSVFQIVSAEFFAFSSGLFRPQVFVSSALLEKLSKQQLNVVLAHENAHCQRRDILKKLLLMWGGLFHFSATRQALLDDIELTNEQLCDHAAVKKVGDRVLVAKTILDLVRKLKLPEFSLQKPIISAFNGSHIDIRIMQLLQQPKPISKIKKLATIFIFMIQFYTLFALTMPFHHLG